MATRESRRLYTYPRRIIAYVRVSSDKQARKGISTPAQIDLIQQECARRGYPAVDIRIEGEAGWKGKSARSISNRPVLNQILQEVRENSVELLIVYTYQRAFRNLQEAVNVRNDTLKKHGCRLLSLTQPVEDGTPEGEAFFGFLMVMAELESKMNGKQTKMTLEYAREKKGVVLGGIPYGYARAVDLTRESKVSNTTTVEVPEQQAVLDRMRAWRADGLTVREIALELNKEHIAPPRADARCWAPSTVHRILKSLRATA